MFVTKRTMSYIQATEMRFLWRVAGFILRNRVRSSDILRELGAEPLLWVGSPGSKTGFNPSGVRAYPGFCN